MAERRNYKSLANDVTEGMITVNPIFLKHFQPDEFVQFYKALERKLAEIRAEPFRMDRQNPSANAISGFRGLHSSMMIVRNHAREKKIKIY